jgi:hypothetical protein
MTWRREPGSGDPRPDESSPDGDRTGYGHWEEAEGAIREEGAYGSCELCGGPTLERHCKILCLTCGYQRDCSDP